jgi:microcystin-dependent protein
VINIEIVTIDFTSITNYAVIFSLCQGIKKNSRSYIGFSATQITPVGAVLPYAGASAPSQFLLCDGSAISRTNYSALFTAIGTVYGAGNGTTTFNLPDLRGRIPVGKSTDTEFDVLGETGGAKTHTLDATQMPVHAHSFNSGADTYGFARMSAQANQYLAGSGSTRIKEDYTTIANAGGGLAHNNIQPYITLNYIIRY